MKRRALLTVTAASALAPWAASLRAASPERTVTVGTTPGPHADILAEVGRLTAQQGLQLQVVPRDGGRAVNADVAAGRLDVACFQDAVSFASDYPKADAPLVSLATTVTLPYALYSRRLASSRALKPGDTVAIPRERIAASRALILLHNHGLITLRDAAGLNATLRDVEANRLQLRLVQHPMDQLAATLSQVPCAVIDSPNAAAAGLLPARDGIGIEDASTPFTGILAVRRADESTPWARQLVASYHSEPIKRFILEHFQDSVRRPW